MIRSFILSALLTLTLVGCIPQNVDTALEAKIAEQNVKIESLVSDNVRLYEKYKSGELTIEDLGPALEANSKAIAESRALLKEAQEQGLSATDVALVGGIGGLAGRSALHAVRAAVPFIPAPWGALASGLLSLVLGGSGGKSREEKDKIKV